MKLRIGGAVLVAAAAMALAGCGGSGGGGQAPSGDALTQYRDCLSHNGVTLPSTRPSGFPTTRPSGFPTARPTDRPTTRPTARPSGQAGAGGFGNGGFGNGFPQGVDASAFAKAQQACASLRPSGQPEFGGNRRQGGDGRNAAYRNCLSEHGVTLQDGQPPASSDPKVAAALQTCAVLKPSPSPTN